MEHESLQGRLERLIPGARVETSPRVHGLDGLMPAPVTEAYRVVGAGRVYGVGATEREAIARAVFLWGSRR